MKRRPFCRVLSWILAALGRLWMILTSKLCDWAEKSSNRRSFCGELSHDHSLVDVDERTSRMEWLLGFNMLAQLSPMVNVSYHFIPYIISLNPWKTSTSLVGRRALVSDSCIVGEITPFRCLGNKKKSGRQISPTNWCAQITSFLAWPLVKNFEVVLSFAGLPEVMCCSNDCTVLVLHWECAWKSFGRPG